MSTQPVENTMGSEHHEGMRNFHYEGRKVLKSRVKETLERFIALIGGFSTRNRNDTRNYIPRISVDEDTDFIIPNKWSQLRGYKVAEIVNTRSPISQSRLKTTTTNVVMLIIHELNALCKYMEEDRDKAMDIYLRILMHNFHNDTTYDYTNISEGLMKPVLRTLQSLIKIRYILTGQQMQVYGQILTGEQYIEHYGEKYILKTKEQLDEIVEASRKYHTSIIKFLNSEDSAFFMFSEIVSSDISWAQFKESLYYSLVFAVTLIKHYLGHLISFTRPPITVVRDGTLNYTCQNIVKFQLDNMIREHTRFVKEMQEQENETSDQDEIGETYNSPTSDIFGDLTIYSSAPKQFAPKIISRPRPTNVVIEGTDYSVTFEDVEEQVEDTSSDTDVDGEMTYWPLVLEMTDTGSDTITIYNTASDERYEIYRVISVPKFQYDEFFSTLQVLQFLREFLTDEILDIFEQDNYLKNEITFNVFLTNYFIQRPNGINLIESFYNHMSVKAWYTTECNNIYCKASDTYNQFCTYRHTEFRIEQQPLRIPFIFPVSFDSQDSISINIMLYPPGHKYQLLNETLLMSQILVNQSRQNGYNISSRLASRTTKYHINGNTIICNMLQAIIYDTAYIYNGKYIITEFFTHEFWYLNLALDLFDNIIRNIDKIIENYINASDSFEFKIMDFITHYMYELYCGIGKNVSQISREMNTKRWYVEIRNSIMREITRGTQDAPIIRCTGPNIAELYRTEHGEQSGSEISTLSRTQHLICRDMTINDETSEDWDLSDTSDEELDEIINIDIDNVINKPSNSEF